MNLRKFLKEIDNMSKGMTKKALQDFVHEYGRILPEKSRQEYLDILKQYADGTKNGNASKKQDGDANFNLEYMSIIKKISMISEGKLKIRGEINYEYDDWYDSSEDEYILSDPDGVIDIICDASEYVHKCVDAEEYKYGYQVAEELFALEVTVIIEDDYDLYNPLGIADFEQYDLQYVDYQRLANDGLYCAYLANDIDDRSDALFRLIHNSKISDIKLETIMQNGEELADIDEFLPLWISYLGKIKDLNAYALLKEALELTGDKKLLLDNARLYKDSHPGLYEICLDSMLNNQEDLDEIIKIGDEALENIEHCYLVRSRIAGRLGLLAMENGCHDKAEHYLLEAFRSDTDVTNFMRIFNECKDVSIFLDEIRAIYRDFYNSADKFRHFYDLNNELAINKPDIYNINMLAFLGGEFQYIKEHAMNVSMALGWSMTFMKCGIAAFILMLYENEKLQVAGSEMCHRIISEVGFDIDKYEKYTNKHIDADATEFFWHCFAAWKEKIKLSDTDKHNYLVWLEGLIGKRVHGIMDANRRNYYGDCASYIDAFGEVLESQGKLGAKQVVMSEYKNLYSRRSAFHQELRAYGMLDTRKKK